MTDSLTLTSAKYDKKNKSCLIQVISRDYNEKPHKIKFQLPDSW